MWCVCVYMCVCVCVCVCVEGAYTENLEAQGTSA